MKTPEERLKKSAHTLAVLVLQTSLYNISPEIRRVVDDTIALCNSIEIEEVRKLGAI